MPLLSHQTALVIIPPPDVWRPIQAIRGRHDPGFRRWMPHINLLYPFVDATAFGRIVHPIEHICQGMRRFSLTLDRFDHFRHRGHRWTLWLAPEPETSLVDLQSALLQTVLECMGDLPFSNRFTPHLTVARGSGKQHLAALARDLQARWEPLAFSVDRVHIISRNQPPEDIFHRADTIPLGMAPISAG